jgi:hypothetical protein
MWSCPLGFGQELQHLTLNVQQGAKYYTEHLIEKHSFSRTKQWTTVILMWVINKYNMRVFDGFIWLRNT